MSFAPEVEIHLKEGRLTDAVAVCKSAIRKDPSNSEGRAMLWQLQALKGEWQSAVQQLSAYSELTGRQSAVPHVFADVIQGERIREGVFKGAATPTIFGEPEEWISYLLKSLAAIARGDFEEAVKWRQTALETAPALSGSLNGQAFQSLQDGDSRLGPIIEVIMNGAYYWMPQSRIEAIECEVPSQLRDLVWTAAKFSLNNGSTIHGFLPSRYPLTPGMRELLICGRETEWASPVPELYLGSGQKVLMTDTSDVGLLELRSLTFNSAGDA